MQNIQEVFNRIKEKKQEAKEIKKIYKEALSNSQKYKDASEELKVLKEKKKATEESIKSDFTDEFDKLDIIKADIESDQILLNDIALNQLIKGETVEIFDENNAKYEPIFTVNFKKAE
ncbi:MAG: hypothetical protein V1891_00560 [bacterium]